MYLIAAGFYIDRIVDFIISNDWSFLTHTYFYKVWLQRPYHRLAFLTLWLKNLLKIQVFSTTKPSMHAV